MTAGVDLVEGLVRRADIRAAPVLRLLGAPRLTVGGRELDLPDGGMRLVALIGLRGASVERGAAARTLWPGVAESRAAGNLRSTLWRLARADVAAVRSERGWLALQPGVVVDALVVDEWATRVGERDVRAADLAAAPPDPESLELLPGWYDDWVCAARDRLRDRLLAGLEAMSERLVAADRTADAVAAALVAAWLDPLRDSAQRAVIRAHLAHGNWVEARRSLRAYRDRLRRDLGVAPDPSLWSLLELSRRERRPAHTR